MILLSPYSFFLVELVIMKLTLGKYIYKVISWKTALYASIKLIETNHISLFQSLSLQMMLKHESKGYGLQHSIWYEHSFGPYAEHEHWAVCMEISMQSWTVEYTAWLSCSCECILMHNIRTRIVLIPELDFNLYFYEVFS